MKCVTYTLQNSQGHEKQGNTEKLSQPGGDERDMSTKYNVLSCIEKGHSWKNW